MVQKVEKSFKKPTPERGLPTEGNFTVHYGEEHRTNFCIDSWGEEFLHNFFLCKIFASARFAFFSQSKTRQDYILRSPKSVFVFMEW